MVAVFACASDVNCRVAVFAVALRFRITEDMRIERPHEQIQCGEIAQFIGITYLCIVLPLLSGVCC